MTIERMRHLPFRWRRDPETDLPARRDGIRLVADNEFTLIHLPLIVLDSEGSPMKRRKGGRRGTSQVSRFEDEAQAIQAVEEDIRIANGRFL